MGKVTSCLAVFILVLIHVAYSLINAATSLRRLCFARNPQPLTAKRRQLPSHLAILFACDNDDSLERFEGDILANVEQIVSWCRLVGIKQLTVYDRQGVLARSIYSLRTRLQPGTAEEGYTSASESEIEYPLTPPSSDDASSRPLSPEADVCDVPLKLHVTTLRLQDAEHPSENSKRRLGVKTLTRRNLHRRESETSETPFSVHVICRESGKIAMANVATLLAHQHQASKHSAPHDFSLSQDELNSLLEGRYGFPPPELMLVHRVLPHRTARNVLELHGFPPWQVRITEFYYDQYPSSTWTRWRRLSNPPYRPLDERKFRHALDEYASAEMRLGK